MAVLSRTLTIKSTKERNGGGGGYVSIHVAMFDMLVRSISERVFVTSFNSSVGRICLVVILKYFSIRFEPTDFPLLHVIARILMLNYLDLRISHDVT
jgi:hypothetical protein